MFGHTKHTHIDTRTRCCAVCIRQLQHSNSHRCCCCLCVGGGSSHIFVYVSLCLLALSFPSLSLSLSLPLSLWHVQQPWVRFFHFQPLINATDDAVAFFLLFSLGSHKFSRWLSNLVFRFCVSFSASSSSPALSYVFHMHIHMHFISFRFVFTYFHFHFRCVTLHAILLVHSCLNCNLNLVWAEKRRENARNEKYFVWQAGGKDRKTFDGSHTKCGKREEKRERRVWLAL